ncbi:Kahuli [Carabus blaptoides fortunei]
MVRASCGRREVQNVNNKDTDDISLVEKLKYCSFKTGWIDDALPLFICYKCYNDLKIAYSFKKMCASNSIILKGYVSRLKYGDNNSVDDHEYRQLRVEIEKNKIYGVNILLYERVQVEEVDMDVSSSDGESSFDIFEDTAIDIKEEIVEIKTEYNENQVQCIGDQEDVICVEQNEHLDKEIIDMTEESTADADICFVEVKHEHNVNLCHEPEHILPDIPSVTNCCDRSTNLTASTKHNSTTKPNSAGEVNLLNIINEQISHFLTSNDNNSPAECRKTSTTAKRTEVSTLRSLLEASKVAQSHVMQSLKTNERTEQADDDIECISSDSESTRLSERHSTKSRHRFKRKVNCNNSLPVNQEPRTYPEVPQSYPLVTDNMNTTSYLQPTNTFLIIYDDINPPAAPLVANTKTTSGFILSKGSLVPNTVPFDSPSASAVPLVINTDINNSYVLPTAAQGSFTYRSENSNGHFVQQTSVGVQNMQGCSYVLPTVDEETSPDSEPGDASVSLTCPICKKTFTKNKYLKQHFETHYSITHNVCAKDFMNEKTHILTHRGGETYKCDYCCKMFARLSEFKKHCSVHVGLKQFECSVCEKRFIKRSSLTKHLYSHNDSRSHKCTRCSQVFQYKCRLEKHVLKHHTNK